MIRTVRVAFWGTPEFASTTLEAILQSSHDVVLVIAQPDRKAGRGLKVHRPETARLAESRGIDVLQPAKIRDEAFLEVIRRARPAVGVVVAYGRILPASLLEIPRHGFLNVHASILPAYRGAAPIQRAIEQGETKTGVSIMQVDEQLDHGPVFEIVETPIGPDERAPALFDRLARLGGEALVRVLDAIEAGSARAIEQDHDRATLAAKLDKSEAAIDWTMTAERIYDRFRAFDPWPGIAVNIGSEPVRLVEVSLERPPNRVRDRAEPGTILALEGDAVVVATFDRALRVIRVQRPGKGPVSAGDFARGKHLTIGSRLA